MYFAFDLDGTLCYRNLRVYLQIVNQELRLDIPSERLYTLNAVTLLEQPETQAAQLRLGDELFRKTVGWSDFDPRSILGRYAYPDAQASVQRIAEQHQVVYCTARACAHDGAKHGAIVQSTIQWLQEKDFVNAHACTFCYHISEKLILLAEHAEQTGEHCILIDDNCTRLFQVYKTLNAHQQALLQTYVSFIAFRAKKLSDVPSGLQVVPLAKWSEIDQALDSLEKQKENTHDFHTAKR
jgi:hypothetical protein